MAAGSSGLGLGVAATLAGEGVAVAICGRDPDRLASAVERIGHGCVPIVCDVADAEGATEFVGAATDALGGVDILVTNAGGPPPGNFASTSVEAYRGAIDANLMSVVAMCKAAVPSMQAQRWGRVVAITSLSVRQPMAQLILSNTARAGATAFLKTLALEVADDGVTVNSLQPGLHRTPRVEELYGEDQVASMRMGEASDFGAMAALLCSEHATFTTGVQLHVDGGAYLGLQ